MKRELLESIEEYGDKSHHLGFVFALWSTKQGFITEKDLREATEAKRQAKKQLLEKLLRKMEN